MNFSAKISPYTLYIVSFMMVWTAVLASGAGHANAAPRDFRAPIAPSTTVVTGKADTFVSLSWKPSKDDRGVEHYEIFNGETKVGTSTGASYQVTGLKPETDYSFRVRAADAAGNLSPFSAPVDVTTEEKRQAKAVIGYYTGWSTYSGHQIAELDGSKLTHINYAFANIGQDLQIELGDVHADVDKWFPGDSAADPYHGNFNQLRKLKQRYPHLKTFISVGGWSWSGKFSDAALTDASRTAFANSIISFLTKYGFDGVDIDWEYPVSGGMPGNVKRAADKQNFTLLMKKLRERLDAQGAKDGKSYLLSMAGASSGFYRNNVELSKLQQYVDFVNVMSYDLHGTWDSKTGFNAPLYRDPGSVFASESSVDDSLQGYLKAGVPAGKLVMGVPFYGYKYDSAANTNKGLYQSFKGGTSVTYGHVVSNYLGKGYMRYFHPVSKVPYLYNGASFISYDDPESIGHKADYVMENGLAGAMVWSLTHDSSDGALLKALHDGLQE